MSRLWRDVAPEAPGLIEKWRLRTLTWEELHYLRSKYYSEYTDEEVAGILAVRAEAEAAEAEAAEAEAAAIERAAVERAAHAAAAIEAEARAERAAARAEVTARAERAAARMEQRRQDYWRSSWGDPVRTYKFTFPGHPQDRAESLYHGNRAYTGE